MPSTMVFDMSDPGVKKMVDGWADNTEYEAKVKFRTGEGATRNVSEVVELEPEASEEAEESEPEMPMKEKMPMKGKMGMKVEY